MQPIDHPTHDAMVDMALTDRRLGDWLSADDFVGEDDDDLDYVPGPLACRPEAPIGTVELASCGLMCRAGVQYADGTVYRCSRERGHKGDHYSRGACLGWSDGDAVGAGEAA